MIINELALALTSKRPASSQLSRRFRGGCLENFCPAINVPSHQNLKFSFVLVHQNYYCFKLRLVNEVLLTEIHVQAMSR